MYSGIAISGKAGSGKTELAKSLLDRLDLQFTPASIVRLADSIYSEAYSMGMTKKDRPLLQRIGDRRTQQEPSYYARLLADKQTDPTVVFVVDDLRKVIEAEYLRQKNFALVRLEVRDDVRFERLIARDGGYKAEDLMHWTETDLDNYSRFDLKVPNNGEFTPYELSYFILSALGMEVS